MLQDRADSGSTSKLKKAESGSAKRWTAAALTTIGEVISRVLPSGHCRSHSRPTLAINSETVSPFGGRTVVKLKKLLMEAGSSAMTASGSAPAHNPRSRSASSGSTVARQPNPSAVCAHLNSGPRRRATDLSTTGPSSEVIRDVGLGKAALLVSSMGACDTNTRRAAKFELLGLTHTVRTRIALF